MDDENTQGTGDLGKDDPMFPNGDNGTAEFPPTAPEEVIPTPTAPASVVESVQQRLAGESTAQQKVEGEVHAESPLPFDLSKMSREQLQTLKSMLAATPDSRERKQRNPIINLRRIDGKMIANFENAYLGLVSDPENRREVERHLIRVQFYGEEEFKPILYSKFINSERVPCEVIDHKTSTTPIIEGETISRETGLPVEMVRTEVKNWFTIKLPDGSQVEIEARLANA